MKKPHFSFILILIILASGCITQPQVIGGGLFVSLKPDPPTVFSSGIVAINIDVDNKNPRTVTDIKADLFDTGILLGNACRLQMNFMRPEEFKSFSCTFRAPPKDTVLEDRIGTTVNARVEYTTDLPVVQVIEMMTEDEYTQRSQSGKFQPKPSSYAYKDKNVEILVEFSDNMPIVVRQEQKDYFVYFTIKNIGNGFIKEFVYGDLILAPVKEGVPKIVDCPDLESPSWKLEPEGKEFPRIACRLILPQGFSVVENYGLLILLKYRYEVRESADVTIIR